jgi:hypothetical protein
MRFAYWITKATNTHPEYVILLAFLRQQGVRERASVLRNTNVASLDKELVLDFNIAPHDVECLGAGVLMALGVSNSFCDNADGKETRTTNHGGFTVVLQTETFLMWVYKNLRL